MSFAIFCNVNSQGEQSTHSRERCRYEVNALYSEFVAECQLSRLRRRFLRRFYRKTGAAKLNRESNKKSFKMETTNASSRLLSSQVSCSNKALIKKRRKCAREAKATCLWVRERFGCDADRKVFPSWPVRKYECHRAVPVCRAGRSLLARTPKTHKRDQKASHSHFLICCVGAQ